MVLTCLHSKTPVESIHFTHAWLQTKKAISVVFPIQSIQSMTSCNLGGQFQNYYVHMYDVPGATLLNNLNIA